MSSSVNFKNADAVIEKFGGIRPFANFPIDIYPLGVQIILIYLIPYAHVAYFPALQPLGKVPESVVASFVFVPAVALLWAGLAAIVWVTGIRRYHSSGN